MVARARVALPLALVRDPETERARRTARGGGSASVLAVTRAGGGVERETTSRPREGGDPTPEARVRRPLPRQKRRGLVAEEVKNSCLFICVLLASYLLPDASYLYSFVYRLLYIFFYYRIPNTSSPPSLTDIDLERERDADDRA